ncbi:hypothetical protein OB955_13345 [Halobacteria archaeon AArc-m2/3/4]|uniref:Uncharacterized protein n=1 Tax=Natronoglomus mannanivorans TaxID=2979990 RepID=A0AAP2YXR7_9EURY|nr:hypothetical protein [Halobacteria archaeon AArc-xg1-1]MCU4973720.1 hypothetical protein [Halobacteria archaeon AArc-m2/3/4]
MSGEPATFDPTPSSVGTGLAAVAALVTVGSLVGVLHGAVLAAVGAVAIPVAVQSGSRRAHAVAASFLFAGATVAGIAGVDPVHLLVAVASAIVAWDAGQHAIGVGTQLGRAASTWRVELAHTAGSLAVASAVGVVAYAAFTGVSAQQTIVVVVLVLAALLLTWLLDR